MKEIRDPKGSQSQKELGEEPKGSKPFQENRKEAKIDPKG